MVMEMSVQVFTYKWWNMLIMVTVEELWDNGDDGGSA